MNNYDVIIIGGGPGGYVAAIRGRQLGLSVALVEREDLGGVCLNWGCIPTKALLRSAEVIELLRQGKTYGFSFDESTLKIDYHAAQKRSRRISRRLAKGVAFLLKKNGVDVYSGEATLAAPGEVAIEPNDTRLAGRNIVVATGARAAAPGGIIIDGKTVLSARDALSLTKLPPRIVIVGAGAIGMEFASLWHSFGAAITVVEMMPRVLPLEDADVGKEVARQFAKRGITILTNTRIEAVKGSAPVTVDLNTQDSRKTLEVDVVLLAAGIRPNSENLGLEPIGVDLERGFVQVDDCMRTSVPGIYAIGDVTGKFPLAHVASAQGMMTMEHIADKQPAPLNYANIPRCTYCRPEVAGVGLTENQAAEQGYSVQTGSFPFEANGKALGLGESEGFVKILSDTRNDELLGVHMVGPHVTEMVAGITGMINLETTVEELAKTVHPHPTLSEAIMEAAHAVTGQAVHM